jgi:hypothetical protein
MARPAAVLAAEQSLAERCDVGDVDRVRGHVGLGISPGPVRMVSPCRSGKHERAADAGQDSQACKFAR